MKPSLYAHRKLFKESVCHGWRIKGFSKNSVGNNRHPQASILNLVCVLFCIGDWATFSTSQQTTLLHRMDIYHFGQNALCLLQMARERMPKENIIKHHTHLCSAVLLKCRNTKIWRPWEEQVQSTSVSLSSIIQLIPPSCQLLGNWHKKNKGKMKVGPLETHTKYSSNSNNIMDPHPPHPFKSDKMQRKSFTSNP